jgi:TRAP transporter TAXI family solute receptor
MDPNTNHKSRATFLATLLSEYFGLSRRLALVAIALFVVVLAFTVYWFIYFTPPRTITILSGPAGSSFERFAVGYSNFLAANGVTLKILNSAGSAENLAKLQDRANKIDVALIQGGTATADGTNAAALVSLGSIAYEPLLLFSRGATPVRFLSDLAGKRIAIGPVGSGTHALALMLLQTNGITANGTNQLLELDSTAAAQGLLAGTVDAVFMMGDSASPPAIRSLLRSPDVQLVSFEQADAYARRFNYLNKLRLPEGVIDLGKNLPAHDVSLIGPAVELIARPKLNPALSDLLLEAAHKVHGAAGIFQNQGEFPAPIVHEFPISQDAARYYKSGKTFLYRWLPFWLASIVNRVLVVIVPSILVLIPAVRSIPAAYKWRIRLRIYRWYRTLLALERELSAAQQLPPEEADRVRRRLGEIETAVKQMKVPASFADAFYDLRQHVDYVRTKLEARVQTPDKTKKA